MTLIDRLLGRRSLTAFEMGMLAKMPTFDPAWREDVQKGWQRCMAYFTARLFP